MGFVTSEKLTPWPLTIVSDIGQAIDLERKMNTGRAKLPLRDALSKVIAEFNKLVTVRRHRVDTARRNLCYNLRLGLQNTFNIFQHWIVFKNTVDQVAMSPGSIDFAPPSLWYVQAWALRQVLLLHFCFTSSTLKLISNSFGVLGLCLVYFV